MRNSLIKTICEEAQINDNIVILTGDLGYHVLDKFSDMYPDRFINCGIAEENMTSVAAGLALEGKCAFTYSIGNFCSLRCLEQIRNDICYHNANVKIVSLAAGFAYGSLGMSHHATEDIACMRALPNMTVFSPCDPLETIAVTKAAIKLKTPCFIRLGRGGEVNLREEFNDFEVGKSYLLSKGDKVVVFSTGAITIEAKKAIDKLGKEGIAVSLYTFPTIKPIDKKCIISCAKNYKRIISVEEHQITGGFGSSIAEVLAEISGEHATLIRVGLQDKYTSVVGDTDYLRNYYNLSSDYIYKLIKNIYEN